ncbi:plasmid mobilization protein MobA, partial [Corynebacterium diphtheriae]|uniref:plasmid mobilization protein MobA n=1 Tax=Corynebacterium diphtheriae TaxID=1717 RepID=UPI003531FDE1
ADRTGCAIVIPRIHARYYNCPGQGFAPTPMSDTEPCFMTKRSGSNTRRRAISRPVRLTAEEDQEIRKRAAECGKTVSGFLRAAALGKKVNSLTDDRVLKEVMRLGALQKKLFIDGKRVGDREYAEVLIAITEYHRALLSRLMAD